mmetsp:Transcript_22829/g.56775  ORF Transcript_22829/g.56775 Transcript_22829/m.56775 type:complete len:206 (-) Transcript_22829:622-1239(-)
MSASRAALAARASALCGRLPVQRSIEGGRVGSDPAEVLRGGLAQPLPAGLAVERHCELHDVVVTRPCRPSSTRGTVAGLQGVRRGGGICRSRRQLRGPLRCLSGGECLLQLLSVPIFDGQRGALRLRLGRRRSLGLGASLRSTRGGRRRGSGRRRCGSGRRRCCLVHWHIALNRLSLLLLTLPLVLFPFRPIVLSSPAFLLNLPL